MSDHKDKAVDILMHYLQHAGFEPTDPGDFRSEMEELVERIGDYVVVRLRASARQRIETAAEMHEQILDEIGD